MQDIAKREKSQMRSLERALHILTILGNTNRSITLTELGRTCQLSTPTVSRMLLVLGQYGFVEKRQGRYRMGAAVLPLAHAYLLGNELTRASLPVLQELAQTSGETISLFVRLGFKRVLIQRVEGIHPLQFVLPLGEQMPLHVGSGKVLAAAMSDGEIQEMLDELGEIRLANGQLVTRKEMLAELERVRKQGYSISLGERRLGVVAVAAPVIDAHGATIAVVSVAGTKERMPSKKIKQLSNEVRVAAKMIAERYDGSSLNS